MKKWLSISAITLLVILIITGTGIYLNLPDILKMYLHSREAYGEHEYNVMLILMYTAGIPAILLLTLCVFLIRNIFINKPFIYNNVKILNAMGICSILLFLTFTGVTPFLISFFPPIFAVVFLVLTLILFIIANLFKIAIKYKEENDLTI